MQITEIYYEKRFNLGDYEHETVGVKAHLSDTDDEATVLESLKRFVHGKEELISKDFPKEAPPLVRDAVKEAKESLDEAEEAEAKEKPVENPAPRKRGRPPGSKNVSRTEPKIKKPVGKYTPYDREQPLHKTLLGKALNEMYPEWKKEVAKVKQASLELLGVDFLDEEGKVLDSFTKSLLEKIKK